MPIAHRSDATVSISVMPGSGGASAPVTTPGSVSTTAPSRCTCGPRRAVARPRPTARDRRDWPKHCSNAPAVASASTWSTVAPVRRTKSSRSVNGALVALVVDAVEQRVVQAAHRSQPEPHREMRRLGVEPRQRPADRLDVGRARFERRVAARRVEIGTEHLHAVAARVAHDRVRRVEAHRLRVQQRGRELGRVVVLDPRARVHEVGEAHRVALGEPEVRERLELRVDLLGGRRR